MSDHFHNRIDAGERLARKLTKYAQRADVLVLALPRGGVPVGFVVARQLQVPLDVLIVRKLGVPGQEELAMGAIALGAACALNPKVISDLGISNDTIAAAIAREQPELERRARAYRGSRPAPDVRDRTVILVDDGIATGATMKTAVQALRAELPRRLVVAAPTIAAETCDRLREEADEVVAVLTPVDFSSVGQWYADFTQTTDAEVCELLAKAARPSPAPT